MTIDDLQDIAFGVASIGTPSMQALFPPNGIPNRDSAIYKYWVANKDVGTPVTSEQELDDHTTGLVTARGLVLHWIGGDQVEVL
jgi:hypothetical protein